jgi:hypothetical protein
MHLLSFLMGYISIYRSGKEHIYIYIYMLCTILQKRERKEMDPCNINILFYHISNFIWTNMHGDW